MSIMSVAEAEEVSSTMDIGVKVGFMMDNLENGVIGFVKRKGDLTGNCEVALQKGDEWVKIEGTDLRRNSNFELACVCAKNLSFLGGIVLDRNKLT
ncbi:hypothetical protein L1887_32718 [Cichorium endivia]|nr:hypothetical protein L1887_32718 [Cichorium endivia]